MAFGATLTLPTITGSHADFPFVLKAAEFPADAIDGGASSIANGGGNLRAYTSSSKTTQLPLEIVKFVTGGTPDIHVWVKVPVAATGNTIYLERDAVETSQPAVTAPYGRNAVWSDYEAVLHLVESGNGTVGEFLDSTGNGYDGQLTTGTSISSVGTSHPFGATWADFTTAHVITLTGSKSTIDNTAFTLSIWAAVDVSDSDGLFGNRDTVGTETSWAQMQSMRRYFTQGPSPAVENIYTDDVNARPAGAMYVVMTQNSAALIAYESGVEIGRDSTVDSGESFVADADFRIGTYRDNTVSRRLDGRAGEARIRRSVLSPDWIKLEEDSQKATGAFFSSSSWFELKGSATAQATAAGALDTSIDLAGNATGDATASGDFSTPANLEGTATAQATATGGLTTQIAITGAALNVATANGALSTSIDFNGIAVSLATANGALNTSITLTGAAIAQALAAAGLSSDILLAAASAGEASATGDLSTGTSLEGNAAAQATASGDITIQITLAGGAVAAALAVGNLTVAPAGLAGDAAGSSTATGVMTTQIPLLGNATAVASGAGNLSTILQLSGAAAAASSATGGLTVSITLNAAALANALAGGDLTTASGVALSADALSVALASGLLTTSISMDGNAVAQAVAEGALMGALQNIQRVDRFAVMAGKREYTVMAGKRDYRVTDNRGWRVWA